MNRTFVIFGTTLVFTSFLTLACSNRNDLEVVTQPPTKEWQLILFCREDAHSLRTELLNLLMLEGWEFQGVLHSNGINCNNTLWTR